MDLNFYSDLSDGCAQNVDAGFLDTPAYGGYSGENKVSEWSSTENGMFACVPWYRGVKASGLFQFPEGSDNYMTINGGAHPFLSAEVSYILRLDHTYTYAYIHMYFLRL